MLQLDRTGSRPPRVRSQGTRAAQLVGTAFRVPSPIPRFEANVGPLSSAHDRACDLAALAVPGSRQSGLYLSPGWLTIDPNFAPLKGHPRFEKLLGR